MVSGEVTGCKRNCLAADLLEGLLAVLVSEACLAARLKGCKRGVPYACEDQEAQ